MDHNPVRGRLSFSIGETLLTSWEAGHLAPGDIVLTSRQAGYPGFVLFNNLPLGLAEVAVLEDTFFLRIVDTDFRPAFSVDPGRIDELGEVSPAFVELGSFEVELDHLRGLGRESLINLGRPLASPNAELRYAGVALARGTVVVVGELMGIRIDERLVPASSGGRVRQSGNLADPTTTALAKVYDFTRPDKFSVTQIRRLGEIHRLFQRNLHASLPSLSERSHGEAGSLVVDQCTLSEARDLLGDAGLPLVAVWEQEGAARGLSRNAIHPRLFEAEDCPRPASRGLRAQLDAARGEVQSLSRPVFVHAPHAWSASDLAVATDALREGWKKYLDFSVAEAPGSAEALNAAVRERNPHEMVILILLKSRADAPPELALVYPASVLEPYLNLLGS